MGNLKYSVIIKVNNIDNFDRNINSIKEQRYNLSLVELFIIDLSNNKKKILNKLLNSKLKFKYLESSNNNYISILNNTIKKCDGEFINIIDSDDYYSHKSVFSKVDKVSRKNNIISISSSYFDVDESLLSLYKMQPTSTGCISLTNNPYDVCLNLNSYFISKDIYSQFKFDNSFNCEYKIKFIMDLLSKYNEYYFLFNVSLSTTIPFETNTSKNSIQYEKSWYIESLDNMLKFVKKYKKLPLHMQYILLYVIHSKINCNVYDRNKRVLDKEEVPIFFSKVVELVKFIDNELLLRYQHDDLENNYKFKMPRWIRYYLFKEKINDYQKVYIENNKIAIQCLSDGKKEIYYNNDLESEIVKVHAINYKNKKLVFDCTTSLSDILDNDQIEIYAKYNGKIIDTTRSYFYPLLKVFGKTIKQAYCFNFSVDINNNYGKLEVFAKINDKELPLRFKYAKVAARLCKSKRSFWHYKDFVLYNKIDYIDIKKAKKLNLIFSEIKFDISKLKNERKKKRVLKYIGLRMLYYITRPFYKNKHVWLTWDKLYKAGDNGEYMYQYLLKKGRNIYYFIKKDSPDYKRLKKQNKKRCVVFNSLKSKILSLHSEVILDTHANVISYCGFDELSKQFVCGLFNPEIICIQHGLTIQKIAQYQNRLFDNIKHYCCASEFEINNIKEPFYDYDESQMTLTGLARYDGLKSKSEKMILITPTWRRNVVNSSIAYVKKKHNNNFKNSDYFSIYNSLINNKTLIECAKKEGYKIVYLLHPAMSGQIDDFTRNDYVEIIAATSNMNYEDILTRAALMVTDYSGVQFDFAYQRKVLVYYHPDALPPHYDDGGLEYETMGFGPICKNEEQIVKELCDNMVNGCKIKSKYKERADKFFAFNDFNNCERILNVVDKYLEENNA